MDAARIVLTIMLLFAASFEFGAAMVAGALGDIFGASVGAFLSGFMAALACVAWGWLAWVAGR